MIELANRDLDSHAAWNAPTATDRQQVYVLDDEPAMRDSLQHLLEAEHYSVRAFATPKQFLDASDLPRPACLILDLTMPGMSGLEVLRTVDRMRPRLPSVILTGFTSVSTAVSAMRLGAVHVLEKPCSDTELLQAVREALTLANSLSDQHQAAEAIQQKLQRLTPRERQLLEFFIRGEPLPRIAEQLGTSPNTVRNQRASILEKMEAESVADLVRMVLATRERSDQALT